MIALRSNLCISIFHTQLLWLPVALPLMLMYVPCPCDYRKWERNDHFSVALEVIQLIFLFYVLSQIGIDVEEKKRNTTKNILSLARRYFTPSEVDSLAEISDSDAQRKEFLKLWTLKVSEALFGPLLIALSCTFTTLCWCTFCRTLSSDGIFQY